MSRTLIDVHHVVGTRSVDQLWRTGPRSWEIVRELCLGVPRATEHYRSEAAARKAFGSRAAGRKPRNGQPATVRIALRITPAEHEAWRRAAAGRKVAEWLREVAETAIAGEKDGAR